MALMECLEPEKLSGLLYSYLAGNALRQAGELSAGQASCLRELVDGSNVLLVLEGEYNDPSPEAELVLLAMGFGMLACIPEIAVGGPGPSPGAPDNSPIWSFTVGGPVVTGPVVS